MAHLHALPKGYEFEGYRIERVLGAGGFGITYQATEAMIGRAVAIKEYLPSSVAARSATSTSVHPLVAADAETFRWGLKRFRYEARTLVSFHHHNIVPVYRYFEANGTAYLVMAYEHGASLAEILKQARTLSEAEIHEFLDPLLDGVAEVHKAGFLHRDIKPANIVIAADGHAVLIDFGAARQALGAKSQSIHSIVSPGYAPFEQYSNIAPQGPYTDIYALGATLYCCVTGVRPVEAPDRVAGAPMRPAAEIAGGRYSAWFLAAIDHALEIEAEKRPQTIAAWRAELARQPARISDSTLMPRCEPAERASAVAPRPAAVAPAAPADRRLSRRALYIGLIAGAVTVVSGGGYALVRDYIDEQRKRAAEEEERKRKLQAAAAAQAEKQRREEAARQRAEAAAQKAREAQARAQAAARQALAAKQQALAAADCARKAAARARSNEAEHYAGLLKNGSRYEGQLNTKTNFPEGCGIMIRTDGARYEGQWASGNWHGYGVSLSKDGIYYEGVYKTGSPDGYGVLRFKDGTEVWMMLVNNVMTGPGLWSQTDGSRYEGDLVGGRWQGLGVLRYGDGSVFEGQFVDGAREGLGVQTEADGKKTHGRWHKNVRQGLE